MRKNPIINIEDVREPFCGCRRRNMVPLVDALPEVASEWCYAKNAGWGPEHFSRGSNVRAWWVCSICKREYSAQINNRVLAGSQCPCCTSKRVCVENSLAERFSDLASQWHPTLNGTLRPQDVTFGTTKRVWWKCSNGPDHEWKSTVNSRTMGRGCPFCKGDKGSVTNSLISLFPSIAAQWHPKKNGKLQPSDVSYGSNKRVWWKCLKGHIWRRSINEEVKRVQGCPKCRARL